MPTNDILSFCPNDLGTNLLTQVQYIASAITADGNQPGVASSKANNKAMRQATYMAHCLAQYLVNQTGLDVLDDATPANVLAAMALAFTPPAPAISKLTAVGTNTYTVPAGALYLRVRMVGGGGGGGSLSGAGGTGGATVFGPCTANGGGPGSVPNSAGGSGGTIVIGGAAIDIASFQGGTGGGSGATSGGQNGAGASGAASPFGGAGGGGNGSSGGAGTGAGAVAGTGSGGGGSGSGGGSFGGAGGGGAGGYAEFIIPGPLLATYSYTIPAGGAGAGGIGGGAGASGSIIVEAV